MEQALRSRNVPRRVLVAYGNSWGAGPAHLLEFQVLEANLREEGSASLPVLCSRALEV